MEPEFVKFLREKHPEFYEDYQRECTHMSWRYGNLLQALRGTVANELGHSDPADEAIRNHGFWYCLPQTENEAKHLGESE